MAIAEGKRRLLITVDEELLKKIEEYCGTHGMSKSQFFSYVSLIALTGSETLPPLLADAFVRNAMDAEIRSQMREVLEAKRLLGLA